MSSQSRRISLWSERHQSSSKATRRLHFPGAFKSPCRGVTQVKRVLQDAIRSEWCFESQLEEFSWQIERANEDGSFGVVTRSKVLTSGPYVWSLPISGEKLCNGDLSRTLRIGFWKYKGNGSHKMQGKDRKFTSRNRYHELLWEVFSKLTESRKYSFLNIF